MFDNSYFDNSKSEKSEYVRQLEFEENNFDRCTEKVNFCPIGIINI